MNLKAVPIEQPPLILWQETSLKVGGVVIERANKPANIYGVCPLEIVEGQLQERSQKEMDEWQVRYDAIRAAEAMNLRLVDLETQTFEYDERQFPMTHAAQTYYRAIEKVYKSHQITTTDGTTYTLAAVNIERFIEAFNLKIISNLEPS